MADRMQDFIAWFHRELMPCGTDAEIICIDGKAERSTVQANGRNPDIVSAYSYDTRLVLATEACGEKSNEIKAVPLLLDKIDIKGKVVTADAMSMQKDIVEKIRDKGGDFLIEVKANQRTLRYGVEDRLRSLGPEHNYTEGPELGHGRIESRTYRIYSGMDVVVDKEKWGGASYNNRVRVLYGEEVNRRKDNRKAPVCHQPVAGHSSAGVHNTQPLVNREHALEPGLQSGSGRYQTRDHKGSEES